MPSDQAKHLETCSNCNEKYDPKDSNANEYELFCSGRCKYEYIKKYGEDALKELIG